MSKKLVYLVSFVLLLSIAGNVSANLVAHWKFDDGSGATAQDSSGNGYDGTLLGEPTWVAGNIGGALEFDGTNDYVELPIGSLISSLTNSTFAIWVDFSNEGGAWQRILDFGTGMTVNMFLTPRIGTDGSMRFAITINGGGDEDQTTAPATLPSGWHYVALTINADENVHSLYLDGELVAQNTTTRHNPSTLGETNQNWLGRSQYAADGYFDGRLDDFRIYDRILSQKQIEDLVNGISPVFTKALNPTPADGAYHPNTWVNLSWKPGDY
ncbi:MAG: LamG domain-containing protein, partial [Planctomycetota bacterium]